MLKRLLTLVDGSGETLSVEHLAREMSVPTALVEEMLQRLGREGYLICASPARGPTQCGMCPMATYCSDRRSGLWQLTEKARTLLATPKPSTL